ncbi:MAG: PAS domain S-box protein, partial [Gammaproteobacteria bacterium]|nr:PAS domain S-box protein [Gammaproteobacteria bacterium]
NPEEFLEEVISDAVRAVVLKQSVVINSANDIVYIKGDIPYLKPKEGKVSNNIFKQLSDDMTLDLRSALNKSSKDKNVQMTPFRAIHVFEDIIRYVRVIVTPIEDDKSDDWLYVLFFQSEESQNIRGHVMTDGDENEIIKKLSLELDSTKSHLQNVIEELETSYEEMQSLNEELQSSNEELQSSNEELETTNEELQSTNEELQTAYSELRVLYDDKDARAKELEGLASKLSERTETNRIQKEITEGILDTAPIAITMVDKEGQITYANKFSEELFGLSKKDIVNRSYKSSQWKITDYNGEDIPEKELPFSIIKRTYEPIHDVRHAIQIDQHKLYLSINGSPQFDFDGQFQGAVFCIENLTGTLNMQNDISYYKDSLNKHIQNDIQQGSYNLLGMSLIDISAHIRNNLSDLSLEIHNDLTDQAKIEVMDKKIRAISDLLDQKTEFYVQKIKYERNSVQTGVQEFLNYFDEILKNHGVECVIEFDASIDTQIRTSVLYNCLFEVFNFLIQVYSSKESILLRTSMSKKNEYYLLKFEANANINLIESQSKVEQLVKFINKANLNLYVDNQKYLSLVVEI